MTHLQVVKALEEQIDASFKRSASKPEEQQLRQDIRKVQELLRKAHQRRVAVQGIQKAVTNLVRVLSPEMARGVVEILERHS